MDTQGWKLCMEIWYVFFLSGIWHEHFGCQFCNEIGSETYVHIVGIEMWCFLTFAIMVGMQIWSAILVWRFGMYIFRQNSVLTFWIYIWRGNLAWNLRGKFLD